MNFFFKWMIHSIFLKIGIWFIHILKINIIYYNIYIIIIFLFNATYELVSNIIVLRYPTN